MAGVDHLSLLRLKADEVRRGAEGAVLTFVSVHKASLAPTSVHFPMTTSLRSMLADNPIDFVLHCNTETEFRVDIGIGSTLLHPFQLSWQSLDGLTGHVRVRLRQPTPID